MLDLVLTTLQTQGIENKNIAIISGTLAQRGISFQGGYKPRWQLTEMFFVPSVDTSQPELLQIAGGLCGKNDNNIKPDMYVTEQVKQDIKAAYALQEQLILEANANFQSRHGNEIPNSELPTPLMLKDVLPTIIPLKENISKREATKTKTLKYGEFIAENNGEYYINFS